MMQLIKDREFGGERPLFARHNLQLENVTIHAGESALKCCQNIVADNCRFEGKYPFWHTDGFKVSNCLFTEGARAALWYSRGLTMTDTLVEAPKMFREMDGIVLQRVRIPNAAETLWHCRNIRISDVDLAKGDYLMMHCSDIEIENYNHQGNYAFQYCTNMVIRNAHIDAKDAFWNTDNVTVYDSELTGEYLAWHSHNLRLVRCRISGTQPLCYCHNLVMEDCEILPDGDLAFEDSELYATLTAPVTSIKNPRAGWVKLPSAGEIIIDGNLRAPGNCQIIETAK